MCRDKNNGSESEEESNSMEYIAKGKFKHSKDAFCDISKLINFNAIRKILRVIHVYNIKITGFY